MRVVTQTAHEASISGRLKSETSAAHAAAERHPLQQMLLRGELERPAYVTHLAQLLALHRALDAALVAVRAAHPRVAALLPDWQLQAPYLEADLDHFGVDSNQVVATPATRRAIERIDEAAARGDLEILGMHYVLEGSKNGSRYIARGVRRSLGLEGTDGTLYLEPYGEEQPARWAAFKTELDRLAFEAADRDRIVAAAHWMFETIGEIGTDVLEASRPSS